MFFILASTLGFTFFTVQKFRSVSHQRNCSHNICTEEKTENYLKLTLLENVRFIKLGPKCKYMYSQCFSISFKLLLDMLVYQGNVLYFCGSRRIYEV